ncbi:MAG: hypothetical protein ACRCX2_16235, partial [Paraclostridium sp.]
MVKNKKLTPLNLLSVSIIRVILIAFLFMVLVPLLWTIMKSFKTSQEFFANPWALPSDLNINNYANAWNKANMSGYFFNSVYVTMASTIFLMILSVPTSYCLARFKFKGCELIMLAMTLG